MPYRSLPSFGMSSEKMLDMPQPGIGGLNLADLEYEMSVNQSPYMLNMMYRNMAFSKRYGIGVGKKCPTRIYAAEVFDDEIFVHSGSNIYKGNTVIATGLPEQTGLFIKYRQNLYYILDKIYGYTYSNGSYSWGEVEPYIPDVMINRKPDGSYGDPADNFNAIGLSFRQLFHGDGTSTVYHLYGEDADTSRTPKVEIDGVEVSFTFDAANKTITFSSAPAEGTNNVEVTWYLLPSAMEKDRNRIMASKYYATFGGNNNSRLFLAGGGESKYYWSAAYDATYFPDNNSAILGNSEDDITGFGLQYNVLIIFKPKEMYSLTHYIQNSSTTFIEEDYGLEAFRTQLVNPRIGCDAPHTIQLINNQLTWFNSVEGVCTLVSTNILDERNVRPLSRNINRTNNMNVKGILDYEEDLDTIQSVDYDNKYFLVFPDSGYCFVWDYGISGSSDQSRLAWFLFDNFHVKQFLKVRKKLMFVPSKYFPDHLLELNDSFSDFDGYGERAGQIVEKYKGINSYYQTPLMQFGYAEHLKNVRNMYVQCRADTSSVIDILYITERTPRGEEDDSINIGAQLWDSFNYSMFTYGVLHFGNAFRRHCNLKKVQMAGVRFSNDQEGRDMSISSLAFSYTIVRTVK